MHKRKSKWIPMARFKHVHRRSILKRPRVQRSSTHIAIRSRSMVELADHISAPGTMYESCWESILYTNHRAGAFSSTLQGCRSRWNLSSGASLHLVVCIVNGADGGIENIKFFTSTELYFESTINVLKVSIFLEKPKREALISQYAYSLKKTNVKNLGILDFTLKYAFQRKVSSLKKNNIFIHAHARGCTHTI